MKTSHFILNSSCEKGKVAGRHGGRQAGKQSDEIEDEVPPNPSFACPLIKKTVRPACPAIALAGQSRRRDTAVAPQKQEGRFRHNG